MLANRGRDTGPERAVRSAVHRRGLRYRVHIRPLPGLRRTADLVFTKARVAVYVDGCFWHQCPAHATTPKTNREFWEAKLEANRSRDQETDLLLAAAGWTSVRIWEHENAQRGAQRVVEAVDAGLRRRG